MSGNGESGEGVSRQAQLGDRLFVADTSAGTVRILAADTRQTLAETPVGPGPYAVVALSATGRVFVALTGGTDEIAILDAATGQKLGTTHLGGLGYPQALAADEAAGRVYALYFLAPRYRQIAVLDAATGAIVGVIPATLDRPLADATTLALDPDRRHLLVGTAQGLLAYDLDAGQWTDMTNSRE
jgi:DNA-binding beta-propeller fold protein YncE